MSGSKFDLIAQELQQQQQILEKLKAENRSLRLELAELHEGRGIFIDIGNTRFALNSSTASSASNPLSVTEVAPASSEISAVHAAIKKPDLPTPEIPKEPQIETPTQQSIAISQEEEQTPRSTFLEDVMINEFETALTSPLSVWTGPVKKAEPKVEAETEDTNAALRRELMGSYLLE